MLDVGDDGIAARVREATQVERSRPSLVGRRLAEIVVGAGMQPRGETSATQRWSEWDPDQDPAPAGCFSMVALAEDLVSAGSLQASDATGFVDAIHDAARRGRFAMSLTMHAVVASTPPDPGALSPPCRTTRGRGGRRGSCAWRSSSGPARRRRRRTAPWVTSRTPLPTSGSSSARVRSRGPRSVGQAVAEVLRQVASDPRNVQAVEDDGACMAANRMHDDAVDAVITELIQRDALTAESERRGLAREELVAAAELEAFRAKVLPVQEWCFAAYRDIHTEVQAEYVAALVPSPTGDR